MLKTLITLLLLTAICFSNADAQYIFVSSQLETEGTKTSTYTVSNPEDILISFVHTTGEDGVLHYPLIYVSRIQVFVNNVLQFSSGGNLSVILSWSCTLDNVQPSSVVKVQIDFALTVPQSSPEPPATIVVTSQHTLPLIISSNTTLTSNNIYYASSNVTVNSSITLNIQPNTTLKFASGKSLTVNGVLNAVGTSSQPITFTLGSGTSPWGTIKLNGSGASGSVIKYANIEYATYVEADNVPDFEISNCNFTDNHKAVYSYNSSGLIKDNYMTSNSYGHVIEIANGSTVDCIGNYIYKTNNSGHGIIYGGSNGNISLNDIENCDWGVGAIYGSSPDFYPSNGSYNNRIRNCNYGVKVYKYSYPVIAYPVSDFFGNSIYNNSKNISLNHDNVTQSTLYASAVYWGGGPLTPSMVVVGTGSTIEDYGWYLDYDPWGMSKANSMRPLASIEKRPVLKKERSEDILFTGISLRLNKKYNDAKDFFISYLSKHPDDQRAYVELYNCYSKETADDIINFFTSLPSQASRYHKLLLSYLYLKKSRNPLRRTEAERKKNIELAEKTNNSIIEENPNTSLSVRAKINNIYIAMYNQNDLQKASSIFAEIADKVQLATQMELSDVKDAIEIYAGTFKSRNNNSDSPIIDKDLTSLETPKKYSLLGNYPNPFNPSTTISYNLPVVSEVEVTIYDILGNEVKTFFYSSQNAGNQKIFWNGRNSNGEQVASGIYLYHFKANSLKENNKVFEKSAKLILMK